MKKINKRNLDDQAKIFSLSCNKKDTSIFRLTVVLKEKINKDTLLKSTNKALKKYKDYKVQLKKGLFGYTLIPNDKEIIIHKGIDYKFNFIHNKENNNYLFKISYEEKTINIDFFHLLTDGSSGREFLNEIIYNYLELQHKELNKKEENKELKAINSYISNYQTNPQKAYQAPQAFQIRGTPIEGEEAKLIQYIIDLSELKNTSKQNTCSLTEFIVSLIAYSLYETHYKEQKCTKPINICIPINLKKYYETNTISNFVSHSMISLNIKKDLSFNKCINMVKEEFQEKLDIEKISSTMTSNGKSINSFLVNIIPLPIKKLFVILGSLIVKKTFTMTVSNLGTSNIKEEYVNYIDKYSFILPPDWLEKIRCAICSHKDKLIISFASNIKEKDFFNKFKELLNTHNITYSIDCNDIKD